MEHKLGELQQQGSRLGPASLANHDQLTQLQHEVLQLTAENEVRWLVLVGVTVIIYILRSRTRVI